MKLYAYSAPDIPKHAGYLKIGETHRAIDKRIDQQGGQVNVEKIPVWQDAIATERTGIDRLFRYFLRDKYGFHIQPNISGHGESEWVQCTVEDIKEAFPKFKEQLYQDEIKRQALGDRFYKEIRNWYYWTTDTNKKIDSEYALRLVIRLLFCFFLREKDTLIPGELFDKNFIQKHLKEDKEYSYYNAILRNLFFHCLNTPMTERKNIKIEHETLLNNARLVKEQFTKIPFLNGGLFDEHTGDDIPIGNDYFFSEKRERYITELGEDCDVFGIIRILSKYHYRLTLDDLLDREKYVETVDPEFIGKVFESLLACIDADSKESRRKITGSFYTPREIVGYMVYEALDTYSDNPNDLLQCKILDPACGSGAFPCGIMNEIMRRLDPNKDLSQSDRYHKKLKIIRDVIYGVDIQPMAVQITLLRFFLSLIQDIVPDKNKHNYGIDPLPNLEIKFVCADALIPLVTDRKDAEGRYQKMLEDPIIRNTAKLLRENRNQYFMASMIDRKQEIQQTDKTLRETLAIAMESNGMITHDTTKKMAAWNPYDQSQPASFFDASWMFGINDDFDIVIGNPPYDVLYSKHPQRVHFDYYHQHYKTMKGGTPNLYKLFFERGLSLIKDGGLLVYITPYNYLTSADSVKLREILLNETAIIEIVDYEESQRVFESATQAVATIITRKLASADYCFLYKKLGKTYTLKSKEIKSSRRLLFKGSNPVIERMKRCHQTFDSIANGWMGEIHVSKHKKFFVDKKQKGYLPLIRGNQIGYYQTVSKPAEFCPVDISARSHYKIRRIVFQEIANSALERRVKGTILENVLCGHTVNYLFSKHEEIPLEALLGLLNSRLVNYYFKFYNQTNHVPIGEIKMIPVPDCLFTTSKSLMKLVTRRLNGEMVDDKIDALVYELYGLTAEEIAIIDQTEPQS